jgi:hypothetical protein
MIGVNLKVVKYVIELQMSIQIDFQTENIYVYWILDTCWCAKLIKLFHFYNIH